MGEEHLAARHTRTIRTHYARHGKELEEKGLLFSCAGQHGENEKRIKIISRQKNKKKCKELERRGGMGIFCTILEELIVRTRSGMHLRSYSFKKGSTVQYMRRHVEDIAKQFQKQDTMQEANPLYPSPITVCMKQFCRIEL